jgi:hypothetical protein
MRSMEDSYQRLGMAKIDILLVHDIGVYQHGAEANAGHMKTLRESGYRALEELRRAGVVSAIGVGVNESAVLIEVLGWGEWDVFLLAGRYTLLEQGPLDDLLPMCVTHGTSMVVGGPLNSGILAGRETWNYASAPPEIVARGRDYPGPALGGGIRGECEVDPTADSISVLGRTARPPIAASRGADAVIIHVGWHYRYWSASSRSEILAGAYSGNAGTSRARSLTAEAGRVISIPANCQGANRHHASSSNGPISCGGTLNFLIAAGFPATTAYGGTSFTTTACAPTTAPSPMVTPGRMKAPWPM